MPLSYLKQADYQKAGLPTGWDVWLAEVEGALLNARLWLERAVKQRDEMKAAEEVGQDEDTDPTRDDQVLRLASFFIAMLGRRP